MLLREYLTEYTKEELLDQARSFDVVDLINYQNTDLLACL